MSINELEFTAPDLFATPLANGQGLPRVFGSASRYVQGPESLHRPDAMPGGWACRIAA